MAATRSHSKKREPQGRVKGETVTPTNTLALIHTLGVTRASRELGVSTTTLHKARRANIVSRVVEIAATAARQNLGSAVTSLPLSIAPAPALSAPSNSRAVFILSVDRDKEQMVREFARMLGAELVAH